jgi:hypothetical protein
MVKTKLSNKEVVSVIESWIDRVSEKRAELNGWSICPFSSKKVTWESFVLDKLDFESVSKICEGHEKEIIIFTAGNDEPDFVELESIAISLNQTYPKLLFFPDHVSQQTYIKDIETGNQSIALIVMQQKDKLFQARAGLEKTDYYALWSEEFIEEIKNYGK